MPINEKREPELRIIRAPEVEKMTGLKVPQLKALALNRRFPAPIKIGGTSAVGWIYGEVVEWFHENMKNNRATG